jgi:hypothetical protein
MENVINFGDEGENFYLILLGLVCIKIPNPVIKDWNNKRKIYLDLLEWK